MAGFRMTLEIDGNGMIVARFEGAFDASEWRRQHRALLEDRYEPADYDGRPAVVDFTRCALPKGDWSYQFEQIAYVMRQRSRKPLRRAIVVGDQPGAESAVAVFAQFQKLYHHPEVETRAFRDFEEGYAWALEALRPPEAPDLPANGRPAPAASKPGRR